MEIPVHRHPLMNLLAKITTGVWLGGASLLTPAVAGSLDQEPAPQTVSKPRAEDPAQTCPGTKQGDAAGKSNPSPREGCPKHSLYRSWRRMTEQAEASQPDWLSPLATTSGRIKDELRYDMSMANSQFMRLWASGTGLDNAAATDNS